MTRVLFPWRSPSLVNNSISRKGLLKSTRTEKREVFAAFVRLMAARSGGNFGVAVAGTRVRVGVGDGVLVAASVGVSVAVAVLVGEGVFVGVFVFVGVAVCVKVAVFVAVGGIAVCVAVGGIAVCVAVGASVLVGATWATDVDRTVLELAHALNTHTLTSSKASVKKFPVLIFSLLIIL